jgi:4a-hydroxytetrahydrobiopterin dehydratase
MTDRASLLAAHCRHLGPEAALRDATLDAALAALPGWRAVDGALERRYEFVDYYDTIAFVNALAYVVHREDHHPDLAIGYNRCTVRFNTHSAGGITANDLICAAKTDALYEQRAGA